MINFSSQIRFSYMIGRDGRLMTRAERRAVV